MAHMKTTPPPMWLEVGGAKRGGENVGRWPPQAGFKFGCGKNSERERQAEKSTHQQDKSLGLFRKCGKSVPAQGACPRQGGGPDEDLSIADMAE